MSNSLGRKPRKNSAGRFPVFDGAHDLLVKVVTACEQAGCQHGGGQDKRKRARAKRAEGRLESFQSQYNLSPRFSARNGEFVANKGTFCRLKQIETCQSRKSCKPGLMAWKLILHIPAKTCDFPFSEELRLIIWEPSDNRQFPSSFASVSKRVRF